MVIKVYIASSSGSVAVKKHQQAVVGFLEANRISFQEVDITMLEEQRLWMYRNIPRDKQPEKGNPLPPQIFNEDRYCGDYEDFFQSKEDNTVFAFLGLSSQPSVKCHVQSYHYLLDPPLCSDWDWKRQMDSNTDSRDR
uniref:SH3 domain-binding glutamic acid-rich-like protein 2 isoform X2 n=1 Tax=Epinephelus lanceolatus TaxID=310571 RepID=UPI0014481329|nr:SH3 domain-binding glutamic acid-rich-like protein 2 isoform X2 [Epinephelus lanceolatus]